MGGCGLPSVVSTVVLSLFECWAICLVLIGGELWMVCDLAFEAIPKGGVGGGAWFAWLGLLRLEGCSGDAFVGSDIRGCCFRRDVRGLPIWISRSGLLWRDP